MYNLPFLYQGFDLLSLKITILTPNLKFIWLSFGSESLNHWITVKFIILKFFSLALTSVETIADRLGSLFQAYRYLAGIMSNLEKLLKLLLSFMKTGQLPSKEAMRGTGLDVLVSPPQLQMSLIIVLVFWIVHQTIRHTQATRFMKTWQLTSKEAMRRTSLGVLMSPPHLQLSLITVLGFRIVQPTITRSTQARSMSLQNKAAMILMLMMMTYLR